MYILINYIKKNHEQLQYKNIYIYTSDTLIFKLKPTILADTSILKA